MLRTGGPAVRVVAARGAARQAVATSRALFVRSPVVVVTAPNPRLEAKAIAAARRLGVPLLVATNGGAGAVAREIARLESRRVLRFGRLPPALARALPKRVDVVTRLGAVGRVRSARAAGGAALVVRGQADSRIAAVTARIAGLRTVAVVGGDPRTTAASRRALGRIDPARIVAIGVPGAFPSAPVLAGLVRTAAGGVELPGGGQILFPGRRVVALYGHPGDANLGVLGEGNPARAVRRARRLAARYVAVGGTRVVPAFELIATVASSERGPDGDFSAESSVDHLRPWVDAARAAGFLVVLDLQPGRTDFLTQARRYEELLAEPHVGLALDPEWRLARGQRHLVDIGHVDAAEVNAVGAWLAGLTRRHGLPQKLFIVHQFRLDMIRNRNRIRTRPELALVVQMDGQGTQRQKLATWRAVTAGGPAGVRFGWKHFFDEDTRVRSPADTIALRPSPVFVSYQ